MHIFFQWGTTTEAAVPAEHAEAVLLRCSFFRAVGSMEMCVPVLTSLYIHMQTSSLVLGCLDLLHLTDLSLFPWVRDREG